MSSISPLSSAVSLACRQDVTALVSVEHQRDVGSNKKHLKLKIWRLVTIAVGMFEKTKSVLLSSQNARTASNRLDFILITVEKFEPERVEPVEKSTGSLKKLIERYTITLGYDSVSLIGTVVTLLTKGKVRVEFRSFCERISLFDIGDVTGQSEAMDLYACFLAMKPREPKVSSSTYTQNLMVQVPVAQVPHLTNRIPKRP